MPLKKQLKRLAINSFGPRAWGLLQLTKKSALDDAGWFESIRVNRPCTASGNPIPWISYPAVHLIGSKTEKSWNVFEFGAGYSTLWWAERCSSVTSCEHDEGWATTIRKQLRSNATLIQRALNEEYPSAAAQTNLKYDVIVIDGRMRTKCARQSIMSLTENGVLVWDDTARSYYQAGLNELQSAGFKRLDLVGMSALTTMTKQTSVLYRADNILQL